MNCVRLWINEQSPITMVEFVVFVMLAGFIYFFCLIPSGRVVYVQCHGSGPTFIYACIGYQVVCLGRWLERRNIGMCWHTWISLLYNIIFSVMVNGTILIL